MLSHHFCEKSSVAIGNYPYFVKTTGASLQVSSKFPPETVRGILHILASWLPEGTASLRESLARRGRQMRLLASHIHRRAIVQAWKTYDIAAGHCFARSQRGEGVAAVIDELLENGYGHVLVVDGYSTDNTAQVARERRVSVVEQHGRGKIGAIMTAIEHVSTPYMLIMHGDCMYDPADIERFLKHANGYDRIVGTRSQENITRIHRIGNRLISGLFNTTISDVCSGMYLLNCTSAREISFRTKGFSVEVEVLAQMAMEGRVTEVQINYRE